MFGFSIIPSEPEEELGPEWRDYENRVKPQIDYYGQSEFSNDLERKRFYMFLQSDLMNSTKWHFTP